MGALAAAGSDEVWCSCAITHHYRFFYVCFFFISSGLTSTERASAGKLDIIVFSQLRSHAWHS